jgi:hypothetical protein
MLEKGKRRVTRHFGKGGGASGRGFDGRERERRKEREERKCVVVRRREAGFI